MSFVNIHGQPWKPTDPRSTTKVKPTGGGNKPAASHKGFRVVGHPPGSLEEARTAALKAYADWHALTEAEQAKRRKSGAKEPKPWDEAQWRKSSKVTAVRSKPYEVISAAEECKAMAERAGWIDVRVDALIKGDPSDVPSGFA